MGLVLHTTAYIISNGSWEKAAATFHEPNQKITKNSGYDLNHRIARQLPVVREQEWALITLLYSFMCIRGRDGCLGGHGRPNHHY